MKDLTWKEALETGGVTLFIFIVLQTCKPDWLPVWGPFAGAAFVLVMMMCGVAAKQKAAAEKEAREEKERQERHEKIEMQKHQMTLDRQEAKQERRRKEAKAERAKATKQEETNGQPAAPA